MPALYTGIAQLDPPRYHREMSEDSRSLLLREEGDKFINTLTKVAQGRMCEPESWSDLMVIIGSNMIQRDLNYLNSSRSPNGRPRRSKNQDLFESHYREHIVVGRPLGSESFERIFGAIRGVNLSDYSSGLKLLVEAWEWRHPGELFYPLSKTQSQPR